MIEVQDLWQSYGRFTALRGISFSAPSGTITGFLGPNGAGKSTAMKVMTTFYPPGAGTVTVAGHDVAREPIAVCRKTGYMPETVALHQEMRVTEYLKHRAALKRLPGREIKSRVAEVMDETGLEDVRRKLLGALSKGYRQRVALADVLLHDPEVLILDEPTSGLDPLQVIEVRRLIEGFRGRRTVLLSSHILGEVEAVCDHVIIINKGEIRARESRAGWQSRVEKAGGTRLLLDSPPKDVAKKLAKLHEGVTVDRDGEAFLLRSAEDLRGAVYRLAVDEGWKLLELHAIETSLEDLFVEVTREGAS